jgi:hypothetical protein
MPPFAFFALQPPLPFSSLPQRQLQSITLSLFFSLLPVSLAEFFSLHLDDPSQASFLLFCAEIPLSSYDLVQLSVAGVEAKVELFLQLASSSALRSVFSLRAIHLN